MTVPTQVSNITLDTGSPPFKMVADILKVAQILCLSKDFTQPLWSTLRQ
jgi:hypothetical protein